MTPEHDETRRNPVVPALAAIPRRSTPSAEVTSHLLTFLLSGDVAPGQKIPSERQLAEALQIGRSAVREAIKSLSLLGLLAVRQGDGTYLTDSPSDLLPSVIEWGLLLGERTVSDLVEARTEIEIAVAGLAAERADDEQLERLAAALEAMRASGDIDAYIDADINLHLEVARASGNGVFANLLSSLQSLLEVWARRVLDYAGETETSLAMHEPIVEAISKHDPDAARAAMRAHMERANRRLHDAVAETRTANTESAHDGLAG